MNYFVRHGEEQLGPFSLADLQQHAQSGRISPGDLAQSEGMQDWAPVSQVIGNIPVPVMAGYGAAAAPAAALVETVPLPPNLHWSIVLLINIFSQFIPFGFAFNIVWTFILANWSRKLDGSTSTMVLVAMYPAGLFAGVLAIAFTREIGAGAAGIGGFLILGGVVAYVIGIFKIKGAMEEYYNYKENIFLKLSGVMTFFFSTIYLQYWVNKITRWKTTGELP